MEIWIICAQMCESHCKSKHFICITCITNVLPKELCKNAKYSKNAKEAMHVLLSSVIKVYKRLLYAWELFLVVLARGDLYLFSGRLRC